MTVTVTIRITIMRGCDVCTRTKPTKYCNNQACPPGRIKYILTIVPNCLEDCVGLTKATNPGPCNVDCRRNATLYYAKITKVARYNGKDCVNGTRGQEDCTEDPCIKVIMIGHIWF